MLKKSALIILFLFTLTTVSAVTTTLEEVNSTFADISIASVSNLYAYEINLDYNDTIGTVTQTEFFASCGTNTEGTSQNDNILSVYSSCLNATHPGVNSSGHLFNVSYVGNLSLRYTLEVYANGTEVYTYYNTTSGTPTVTVVTSGSGSGGSSSGGVAAPASFSLSPDLIKVEVSQGGTERRTFEITNLLSTTLNISSMSVDPQLEDFALFGEDSLVLLPGETVEVDVDFFARKDELPETYTGRIIVRGANTQRTINLIVEIQEDEPLFDVTVDLERERYAPGETVIATIDTINVGDLRDIDALVYYSIRDFEGNEIAFKEESYAIENYRIQLIGRLDIPENTPSGQYLFYTKVSYSGGEEDIVATGSQVFTIGDVGLSPALGSTFLYIAIPVIIVAIIIITIVLYLSLRKKENKTQ